MRYEERKESGLFDWLELEKTVSRRQTLLSRLDEAIDWKHLAAVTEKNLNFKAQKKGVRHTNGASISKPRHWCPLPLILLIVSVRQASFFPSLLGKG